MVYFEDAGISKPGIKEEIKTEISVGDLMTRDFIYVSSSTDLKKCAETMVKKRVGSLIVKDGERLEGILTEKDIIWVIVKKSESELKKLLAKDLMKRRVVVIKPGIDVVEALEKMKKFRVRRLPVIENGKVIGMLTLNDILRVDPGLFQLFSQNVQIKEEAKKLNRGMVSKTRDGICEECGEPGLLYFEDGQWTCPSCYYAK